MTLNTNSSNVFVGNKNVESLENAVGHITTKNVIDKMLRSEETWKSSVVSRKEFSVLYRTYTIAATAIPHPKKG